VEQGADTKLKTGKGSTDLLELAVENGFTEVPRT
jgi:hypothetical protein